MDITEIFTWVIMLGGFGFIYYKVRHLDRYRKEEAAAREFFDENGRWPDESPEDAHAQRERLRTMIATDGDGPVASQADAEGLV